MIDIATLGIELSKLAIFSRGNWSAGGELHDLSRRLLRRYHGWKAPTRIRENSIEIFAPSLLWPASSPERFRSGNRESEEEQLERIRGWINGILHLSLYVDRLWIPDPAEIFAYDMATDDDRPSLMVHMPLMRNPLLAAYATLELARLAPLFASGALIRYPPLLTYHRSVSKQLFGQQRFFTSAEIENAWPDLYVSEGLLFADALDAAYAALHSQEHSAIVRAATDMSKLVGVGHMQVISALPHLQLPSFSGLDPGQLASVRKDGAAFDDFRLLLRQWTSAIPTGIDDAGFREDVSKFESDVLSPALLQLTSSIRNSTSLRKHLSDAGIDFSVAAFVGFTMTSNITNAAAAGAVGALAKVLLKLFTDRDHVRPAARVAYAFTSQNPLFGSLMRRRPQIHEIFF